MSYLYLKALHIIFIVTWFAGLFYMVRLFIYQTETQEKPEPERSILTKEYKRISKLLWHYLAISHFNADIRPACAQLPGVEHGHPAMDDRQAGFRVLPICLSVGLSCKIQEPAEGYL